MANPTPKNTSTRVQLPVGPSGTEPPNAPEGGLAYANDTEVVRVKTSTGWEDVAGGGGGGTITEIVEGPGIDITGGTGPIVTVGVDTNPATSPFVLKDITGAYPHDSTPSRDDHVYLQDTVDGSAKQSRVRELPVIEKDFSVYTFLAPSVNSDIVYNINGSPGAVRTCNLGDVASAGQVTGTLSATKVVGITETSGPTALAIGPINDFQLLQRVGSTVVGTAYPPTTLAGDVNGPMTSNQVNAIHETSGPTQLTIGAISDGQILQRVGTTVVGSAGSLSTGNPYLDPPAVPNAFDDEFDSGSADLATRGWQIWDSVVGGVLTRAGDIDIWSSTALENPPVSGTYRSSIVGSYLLLQLPVGGRSVSITRAFTPGTSGTVYGRVQGHFERGIAVADITNAGIFVEDNNTAANRVNVGVTQNVTPIPVRVVGAIKAGVYNTLTFANLSSNTTNDVDIVGLRYCGTATYYDVGLSTGGFPVTMAPVGGFVTNTPNVNLMTRAGAVFDRGATTTNSLNILAIDFLRFVPGDDWIAHAPKPVLWNVNASIPVAADITTKLAPLHWWRADNTVQTGGLVDTIVDNGSVAKDFTQTGAARCPTAVDGNGNTYLAFDGVTDFYTAGVAADWTFMHTATNESTIALILHQPSALAAGASMLDTGGDGDVTKIGMTLGWTFASAASQGMFYSQQAAVASNYITNLVDRNPRYVKRVWILRAGGGGALSGTTGNVTSNLYAAQFNDTGTPRAWCAKGTAAQSSASPSFTLTLGAGSGGTSAKSPARIYEVVVDNKLWTDEQVAFFEAYAGAKYGFAELVPTATNVSTAPYVSALINTYSPKSAPVAADQIYIADSGASNAIKRSTISSFVPLSPYETAPASPNAFNDEFNDGNADLAVRGWTVINAGTGATMTRAGDINAYTAPTLTATTYLSTLRNGRMWVQCSVNLYMYKAVSGSFNITANCMVSRAQANQVAIIDIYSIVPPITNSTRRLYCGMNSANVEGFKMDVNQVYTSIATSTTIGSASLDAHVVDFNSSGTAINMQCYGIGGRLLTVGSSTLAGFVPIVAGFSLQAGSASLTQWAELDYIRLYPQGTFFPA